MPLLEDDGFNLRSSKIVLIRKESHRYVSGLVFVDEEDAT